MYLAALFVNPSNTSIQRRKDTMEDELNYLRSEIAKIRMEKEKANGITPGWLDITILHEWHKT